jgi:RsiW-degrading membrane proteinase PrsW (M82 family)
VIWLALLLALLPSWWLMRLFLREDRFPEPRRVVITTFLLGILIVIPILPIAFGLMELIPEDAPTWLYGFLSAFLGAAIPEESLKFLVLTLYCLRHEAFDEPMDGIVYGVTASLGFATLENVLYVSQGGVTVALARAFTAVPMHAFCGVIMGYNVGRAHLSQGAERRACLWKAILVPIAIHGVYDAPLFMAQTNPDLAVGALLAVVVVLIFAWRHSRKVHGHYKRLQARTIR